MRLRLLAVSCALLIAACSSSSDDSSSPGNDSGAGSQEASTAPHDSSAGPSSDGTVPENDAASDATSVATDATTMASDATSDAPVETGETSTEDSAAQVACKTKISYGSTWIAPANHSGNFDTASASVTWDGTCTDDGSNSYAVLSNGWKPYFTGHGACVLALDYTGSCGSVPTACTTRVTYGSAWLPPANHANHFDDVTGRVFTDGACTASGSNSYAKLSNGWTPNFSGTSACSLSFEYRQCGGLYTNPVIPNDCADPGVLRDGDTYYLACTSGDAPNAYPIYTSTDLATWTLAGHVFPSGQHPTWAVQDFWAPEIHKVGSHYVVYFSARGSDGVLAIGAASATSPLGPFTSATTPLIHDPNMGLIDASEFNAPEGPYVLWKEDGNAKGVATPIHAQLLSADGVSLGANSTASTLITNDQSWEGSVTEGPFLVSHSGYYYLFYSGNSYANATYAVGVARGTSLTQKFAKPSAPILVTGGAWVGPGHCSVLDTPAGDTAIIYHAWKSGCVNTSGCGREDLVNQVLWGTDWPSIPLAPSSNSRPLL